MKQYPKRYEDLSKKPSEEVLSKIGSSLGSSDEFARRFRIFSKEAHLVLFNLMVKQVWYEQKYLYDNKRRNARSKNGYNADWAFSFFMKGIVGISQKPLTDGFYFMTIPTYFNEFFPNFFDHDPEEESEYFKYPFKHVTLDHLGLVYQMHNRMEMLEEAERRSMTIHEFENFVVNWIFTYAEGQPSCKWKSKGKEIEVPCYMVFRNNNFIPYIKDMRK